MAETDEDFYQIGLEKITLLKQYGFRKNSSLLDLGCGYGRLPYAMIASLNYTGQYLGLDILPRHIRWCQDVLTSRHPHYRFAVIDVQNDRYNPQGLMDARAFTFDLPAACFDFVCLFSVFTHMHEPEIAHYLSEILRVLKPDGKCLATFFLYDEDRLSLINAPDHLFNMPYRLNDHTLYHNAADQLHAICYRKDHVLSMISGAAGKLLDCTYGAWARGSSMYQDLVVFSK